MEGDIVGPEAGEPLAAGGVVIPDGAAAAAAGVGPAPAATAAAGGGNTSGAVP